MKASSPHKACLLCPEKKEYSVVFKFNPSDINVLRRVQWSENATGGGDPWGGELQFSGGTADELEFTVLLDETFPDDTLPMDPPDLMAQLMNPLSMLSSADPNVKTVVESIKKLQRLTMPLIIDAASHDNRPPVVVFQWGTDFRFLGTLEAVSTDILLVDERGRAKRAEAKLQMKGRSFTELESIEDFFSNVYELPKAAAPRWSPPTEDEGISPWQLRLMNQLGNAGDMIGVAVAMGAALAGPVNAIADLLDGDPEGSSRDPFTHRLRNPSRWTMGPDGWTLASGGGAETEPEASDQTEAPSGLGSLQARKSNRELRESEAVTYQDVEAERAAHVALDQAAAGGNYSGRSADDDTDEDEQDASARDGEEGE